MRVMAASSVKMYIYFCLGLKVYLLLLLPGIPGTAAISCLLELDIMFLTGMCIDAAL